MNQKFKVLGISDVIKLEEKKNATFKQILKAASILNTSNHINWKTKMKKKFTFAMLY